MPRRIPRYLVRARHSWTDMTAFTVFIAFTVGLALLVDVLTPTPLRVSSLAHLSDPQRIVDALILWTFVAIAFRWPLFGGLASGVMVSCLFAVGAVTEHSIFGTFFWVSLGIAVIVSTFWGIHTGNLRP